MEAAARDSEHFKGFKSFKLSCSGTRVASTRHSRAATYVLQLMPMHFSWTEVRHWVFLSERHVDAFFGESKMHWHIS